MSYTPPLLPATERAISSTFSVSDLDLQEEELSPLLENVSGNDRTVHITLECNQNST